MKLLLIFMITAFMCSCSSKKEPVNALSLDYKYKSKVEIEDKNGKMVTVDLPGSKPTTIIDPVTGERFKSEGWVDPTTYNQTPGVHLKKLTNEQLYVKAQKCTAYEAILIIDEVRSRRTVSGVKVFAAMLSDDRTALFSKKRNYWWYESKGKSYEKIEVRSYAAFAMQNYLKVYPSGVTLLINHDEYLIYAVKDSFAVVKADVSKVWLNWWLKNKAEYL
jgi:hypothetical protein